MPRGERPLDDGDSPVLRFAADLRRLRESAGGPSYRELARRANFSSTALSDAAAGRRLPGLEIVLGYVRGCGGEEEQWRQRWHDVAAELAVTHEVRPARGEEGPAPYIGLSAFGPQDADLFFGRETVVQTLLSRLEQQRFVAVFGASGEGKSSLLRAGLAPKIRAVVLTPGPNPAEECAIRLAAHTGHAPGQVYEELLADPLNLHRFLRCTSPDDDLVLVIDQFEEVFTLCSDSTRRSQFIDMLLAAVDASNSRTRVVLGVRSDFYPHCALHPALAAALTESQVLLSAMTVEELRRAITRPAVKVGCSVEAALLTTLVAEASGRSGVMPLVSHALLETWRRRRGHTLTLTGYQAAGGIQGALARSAETVFSGFTSPQQALARQVLLRLTALGEGTEDTKRRIALSELPETGAVLDELTRARLLTVSDHSVEITHEALFRAWPRLREWLAEDRDGLRIHHRLTEAARLWEELGRDTGVLYRTTRLALTSEWAARACPALSAREQHFLTASQAAENAERAVARRRTRQLRWLVAGLVLLLVLATGGAGIAVHRGRETQRLGLITQSRQLVALSEEQAATNPEGALRTALQAYDTYPTVEARSRLLTANTARPPHRIALDHDQNPLKVSYSPNGTIIAVLADVRLTLYDAVTLAVVRVFGLPAGVVRMEDFAFSPDGRTIAVVSDNGWLFQIAAGGLAEPVQKTSSNQQDPALTFSADSRSLVIAGATTTVWDWPSVRKRWDLAVGRQPGTSIAIASDNRTLVLADARGDLQTWDVETGERRSSHTFERAQISRIEAVPNSSLVAVSFHDSDSVLWDVVTGTPAGGPQPRERARRGVAVSVDGTVLASADEDSKVRLWDLPRGVRRRTFAVGEQVSDVAFGPDGTLVVLSRSGVGLWPAAAHSGSSLHDVQALSYDKLGSNVLALTSAGTVEKLDHQLRVISTTRVGLSGTTGRFSPDRTLVAVASPGEELAVHDLTTSLQKQLSGAVLARYSPRLLAFRPDSRALVATGAMSPDAVWNLDDPGKPVLIAGQPRRAAVAFGAGDDIVQVTVDGCMKVQNPATVHTLLRACENGPKTGLALSPDRRWLAVASASGAVTVWDSATWRVAFETSDGRGSPLTAESNPSEATALEFSPDSTRLAISSANHKIVVFDISSGQNWATLSDDTHDAKHLAWRPDGRELASVGIDDGLRFWPVDVDEAVREVRARLGS